VKKYLIALLLLSFSLHAKECTTVDLSAEGNVLHPLRATHQNGLGICHAEQLQRMLKAKMTGHPDLARVSLAILEKEKRDESLAFAKKKAIRWKNSDGTPGGYYFDAGNACEAYELVKGHSVCESKNDLLERFSKTNANNQKRIMDALSLVFDKHSSESFAAGYRFRRFLVNGLEEVALNCPIPSYLTKSFTDAFFLHSKVKLDPNSFTNFDGEKYLISKDVDDYLNKMIPPTDRSIASSPILMVEKNKFISALKTQENCILKAFSSSAPNMCPAEETESKKIFSLSSIGLSPRDMLKLLYLSQDRDDYFSRAIECHGSKVKIPNNLICSTVSLIEMKKNSANLSEYINKFSSMISLNLENNTPIGISVCTRFFKNPNVTTIKSDNSYGCGNKNDPHYKAGEGSHAVTIIGRRCVRGKTQFLVHNSWGTSCGYYSSAYECNKQGGFWVDGEILSQNARLVNILK
jgi:hypothetical protein